MSPAARAARLRAQIPSSTDPARLERMACALEGCEPSFGAEILAAARAHEIARAQAMPRTRDALDVLWSAYQRLRELGWREIIYCPKDGTVFDSIEAGSTGIHDCFYQGDWPDGSWWAPDAGDLWPARPILFRDKRQ